MDWSDIQGAFRGLLAAEGRRGLLSAVPVADVMLLPEQHAYLQRKLAPLGLPEAEITAVSLGIAYEPTEVEPIPTEWKGSSGRKLRWNDYAAAYHRLNGCLSRVCLALAESFGGVREEPTLEGIVGQVGHVTDYFPACVSHRAFAVGSRLGWRGRHQLIVTPEFGPAFRLATVFLPGRVEGPTRELPGCGECHACVEVCPVLERGLREPDLNIYREMCRKRISGLGLAADVCGLCLRRCWEVVVRGRRGRTLLTGSHPRRTYDEALDHTDTI